MTSPQHFRHNHVGIILRQAPVPALDAGILAKMKTYFVLAWVDPETRAGNGGA